MNTEFKTGGIVVLKDPKVCEQRGFPPGAQLKILGVKNDDGKTYVWVYWKDDPNADNPLSAIVLSDDIVVPESN